MTHGHFYNPMDESATHQSTHRVQLPTRLYDGTQLAPQNHSSLDSPSLPLSITS